MAVTIRASLIGLEQVNKVRTLKGWTKTSSAWADSAHVSSSTLKRFWRGLAISIESFISICDAVGVSWEEVAELKGDTPEGPRDYQVLLWADVSKWNLWKKGVTRPIIDLENIDLSSADLRGADLRFTSLRKANLRAAILVNADLREADLTCADLSGANLEGANLSQSIALGAIFSGAKLTGACIEDWNINSSTSFDGVECKYIFRKLESERGIFSSRLPIDKSSVFSPGVFEQWAKVRKNALDTIDITFTDGVDWKAFFHAFQELRQQYPDKGIAVQSMEKNNDAFIVRLKLEIENEDPDLERLKGEIENQVEQLYEKELKLLESKYEERLRIQGAHLEDVRSALEFERKSRSSLLDIITTMTEDPRFGVVDSGRDE